MSARGRFPRLDMRSAANVSIDCELICTCNRRIGAIHHFNVLVTCLLAASVTKFYCAHLHVPTVCTRVL